MWLSATSHGIAVNNIGICILKEQIQSEEDKLCIKQMYLFQQRKLKR